MGLARCIGCDQLFETGSKRSDTKHCPACQPLRGHRGPSGRRLPVAVLRALGTTCSICGGSIDLTIRAPDPRTPSIDHVVARAIGGSDDPANLRIAHLWCNQAKHLRRGIERSERDERQRFYNLRVWRRLAAAVREEEPSCRRCGSPSECASHIVALELGGKPWERSNIEALCQHCRNIKAQETYMSTVG